MYQSSTFLISFQASIGSRGNYEPKYYAGIDFVYKKLKITQPTFLKIIVIIDGVKIKILFLLSSLTIFPNKYNYLMH